MCTPPAVCLHLQMSIYSILESAEELRGKRRCKIKIDLLRQKLKKKKGTWRGPHLSLLKMSRPLQYACAPWCTWVETCEGARKHRLWTPAEHQTHRAEMGRSGGPFGGRAGHSLVNLMGAHEKHRPQCWPSQNSLGQVRGLRTCPAGPPR